MLTYVESPAFTRQCAEIWSDAEYSAFQQFLAGNPEVGNPIPGLGGLRKVRWSGKGRGKRGGARVIYLILVQPGVVYLLQAYTKGDIADLSPEQKKRLRTAVEDIKKHHTK
jgi:mRNA-degrading endonuclease RelE of RelBE toxin-antitoxin system